MLLQKYIYSNTPQQNIFFYFHSSMASSRSASAIDSVPSGSGPQIQSKQTTGSGSGRGSGGRGSGDAGPGDLASLQGIEFVLYLHQYFEAELATFHSGNLLGYSYLSR